MHLFFSCNFSIRIWNYLQVDWFQGSNMQQCISKARRDFGHPFFLEVVFTAAWNIWILRNCQTFRAERASFGAWKCKFVHDISLLAHRVRTRLGQSYWLGSITRNNCSHIQTPSAAKVHIFRFLGVWVTRSSSSSTESTTLACISSTSGYPTSRSSTVTRVIKVHH